MADDLSDADRAREQAARWHETGRRGRFGAGARKEARTETTRRERQFRDMLDRLLQDAEYRLLYERLGDQLTASERDADQVLAELTAELAALDLALADMETRAARAPDGRAVFRTSDGRVVDTNGHELAPEIAEGIVWPPNAPSAEAYFATRDRRDALIDLLREWQLYRTDVLGMIRDRYEDRSSPIPKSDLPGLIERIETERPKRPADLNMSLERPTNLLPASTETLTLPPLPPA